MSEEDETTGSKHATRPAHLVPVIWTKRQRAVVAFLLLIFIVVGSYRLVTNQTYVSDPPPAKPSHYNDLADRIDPNTADADTLGAIPQLGQKRAAEIVAYREKFVADHPGILAFKDRKDLLNIRGIGVSMLLQMEQYLIFPTKPVTTSTSN